MQLKNFRCHHRLTVRGAEVDAQSIVYNAHYLTYVDCAMAQYWRETALPIPDVLQGGKLKIHKTTIAYQAPAKAGDVLDIGIRCIKQEGSALYFEAGIFTAGQLLNTVVLVYQFVDAAQQPQELPAQLCEALTAFENGQEMVKLLSGNWNDLGRLAERLRMDVFVKEQGVPIEMEIDEFDPICRHVVAVNHLGQPVGTGRLVSDAPGIARIGRMAVVRPLRGTHIGYQVLQALIAAARARKDKDVVLHAQLHAQDFYARVGFVAEGDVFDEAGIEHITMRLTLSH